MSGEFQVASNGTVVLPRLGQLNVRSMPADSLQAILTDKYKVFLNNPSIVAEITRERLEMLGASFIPQHSDARVLEQLLYKWPHARRQVASALAEQYAAVIEDGRPVTVAEMSRDVTRLFAGNFQQWTAR